MNTKYVVVEPYNPQWVQDFEKIKQEVCLAVGDLIVAVEHVGSTSVIGLSAKPIIDIDIVIADISLLQPIIQRLAFIGYIHEGDLGITGREAFKYVNKPHLKEHHLYVCAQNSQELHRHLTFRNYLRTHPEAVAQYSKAKENAANLYPNDIRKYMEYKSTCIEHLYTLCGLTGD